MKHTPETIAKIGAAAKARWATPEFRERMRVAHADTAYKERQSNAHKGKPNSPAARAKQSEARKAWWAKQPCRGCGQPGPFYRNSKVTRCPACWNEYQRQRYVAYRKSTKPYKPRNTTKEAANDLAAAMGGLGRAA